MICSRASTLSVLAGPGIRLPQQGLRHSPDIKASDKGTVAGGRDDQLHQCGMTPSSLYEKNTENDENDDKRVKLLLEKGADVESKEGYGGTPLWLPSGMGTRPSSSCFNENLDNYETTLFPPSGK
ncbi:hypothetical protein AUP68_15209 [Ilyonectria robusta]